MGYVKGIYGTFVKYPITFLGATNFGESGTAISYTAGTPVYTLYATNAGTSGSTSAEPFYVYSVLTGAGQVGGRARFHCYTNVASGGWVNALKSYMEFGTSGTTSGLASSMCVEMLMKDASTGTGGVYAPLEIEYVAGGDSLVTQGNLVGNYATFMYIAQSGDADGDFDDHGFFMSVQGCTAGSGHLLSANSQTLKVGVGSATRYMVLSQAEDTLSLSGSGLTLISLGSGTKGIDFASGGTVTNGITFSGTVSDAAVSIGGTYDHGIYFSADPQGGDNTNSFINIGDYGTAIAVAPTTAHMFGVMHNVTLTTNVNYWYQAYYTKITTSGTTTSTSIAGHAYRMQVGSSLGAVYGIQCHTNITATNTCGTEIISVSAYVNLGSGSTTTTDRVCALQAMIEGAGGTVTGDQIVAYIVNAGTATTTDSIMEIKNQSACTATSALTLDLDGTITYAINFDGTVSDGWTSSDETTHELGAYNEYSLIPVKVEGVTPTLYIMAAETWQSVD